MACSSCDVDGKYYIGDIGTEILVDTCSDLTAATVTNLLVEKPDGTADTWVGTVENTTYIKYTVVSGDFDQIGEYRVQAYVEMPGWSGRGNTVTFKVTATFG